MYIIMHYIAWYGGKTFQGGNTMKNVLIGYYSRTGSTEEMAKYLAEGIRVSGNNVELKKISAIKSEKDLDGYDGFIFGCPTYHKDITGNFKTFLFLAKRATWPVSWAVLLVPIRTAANHRA